MNASISKKRSRRAIRLALIQEYETVISNLEVRTSSLESQLLEFEGSARLFAAIGLGYDHNRFIDGNFYPYAPDFYSDLIIWELSKTRIRIKKEIKELNKKITRFKKSLNKLKFFGSEYQIDLRHSIRELYHFLFKNLDDTHKYTVAPYIYMLRQ